MNVFILVLLAASIFGLAWWIVGILCKREEERLVAEAEAMRPVAEPKLVERTHTYPPVAGRPTRTLTGTLGDYGGGVDPATGEFFDAAMAAAIAAGQAAEMATQIPVEGPLPMEDPSIPTEVYVDQQPTPEAEQFLSVPAAPPAFPTPPPDPVSVPTAASVPEVVVPSHTSIPTPEIPSYTSVPDSSPSYGGDGGSITIGTE